MTGAERENKKNGASMPKGLKGFQKGELNPSSNPKRREEIRKMNTGKKLSAVHRKKISRSMKTALENPELREKWRKKQIGVAISEETKEKISAAHAKRPKTIKGLKLCADRLFSKYVRYRDSELIDGVWIGTCITCDGQMETFSGQAHAGHFVSRRVNALRYEEENVNLQCASCNVFKYGEQYLYAKALDLKYGDGKAEELMSRRHETHKFTKEELEEIIHDSKTQIKFYETEL